LAPIGGVGVKILDQHVSTDFVAYHGDNIEVVAGMPDGSIDLTVTSPPFPAMYVYTDSPRDVGNTSGIGEMLDHFRFLVRELCRVTRPGRTCCVHLTNVPAFKHSDGYVGRFDFRGDVIRLFQAEGWIYASEVLIDKCPQVRAQRTKDRGLLFKSLGQDSSVMAPVMPDYLLVFRRPGDNATPIRAGKSEKYGDGSGWISQDEWIEWAGAAWNAVNAGWMTEDEAFRSARDVWYRQRPDFPDGVKETDVLNVSAAREAEDERHLCPLQLGVIERCVKLWSAPGEVVFDPFGGIGSTPYQAVKLGRRGAMVELKESYYRQAVRNCKRAEGERSRQRSFFDLMEPDGIDWGSTPVPEAIVDGNSQNGNPADAPVVDSGPMSDFLRNPDPPEPDPKPAKPRRSRKPKEAPSAIADVARAMFPPPESGPTPDNSRIVWTDRDGSEWHGLHRFTMGDLASITLDEVSPGVPVARFLRVDPATLRAESAEPAEPAEVAS
jgi:hypothetical protein